MCRYVFYNYKFEINILYLFAFVELNFASDKPSRNYFKFILMVKKLQIILVMQCIIIQFSFTQSLSPVAQALYYEAYQKDPSGVQSAIDNGAEILPTPDGNSFYVTWFPEGVTPSLCPVIVTLHGSDGNAFNRFYEWRTEAQKYNCGIIALQWYRGDAAVDPDNYFNDTVIYTDIDYALTKINYPAGKALLHGFSRGASRSYAIAFEDLYGGKNYFCDVMSNAGNPDSSYALYHDIYKGDYGTHLFSGKHWSLYCGGQDPNTTGSGCVGMTNANNWLISEGASVDIFIQDANLGHEGFATSPAYIDSVLENYISLYKNPVCAIEQTGGNNPSCAGESLTFTATAYNGGKNPAYKWMVDGLKVGTNSSTYTATNIKDGQVITCEMKSSTIGAQNNPASSNSITMFITSYTPTLTITESYGSNPTCSGSTITFLATQTYGGSNPTYQWKVNGKSVGTNSPSYSTSSLTNGQIVSCILTSNASCVSQITAVSNSITMGVTSTITPAVSIAIGSGSNPTVKGSSVTFKATPTNGGSNPTYQWKVSGVNVGTNSSTYTTTSLTNGQIVKCTLTSSETCVSKKDATSNSITMTVTKSKDSLSSIDQTDEFYSDFNLYPNPNDGNFTLSFNVILPSTFLLDIRNILGQLIYQESVSNFKGTYSKQMNVSNYGKGIYVVVLTDANNRVSKSFVVR